MTLIVPLAKLLSVSTDTLLGMDTKPNEERLQALLQEIKAISNWREEGRAKRLALAKNLISEFPDHFEAVFYYESCLGDRIRYDTKEEDKIPLLQEQEKYCKRYLQLVPEQRKHGQHAVILSLISILCELSHREEAIALADRQTQDREFQLQCYARCLTGDEKEIKMLKNASEKAHAFLRAVYSVGNDESFTLAEAFYRLMDPIPNDEYYQNLITLHDKKARAYYSNGLYDKVMAEYALCAEYAIKIEDYVSAHPENEPWYSHPMFKKCMRDKEIYKEFNPHDMVRVFLTTPSNKALFDREDHRALVEAVTVRANAYDPFNVKK